MKLITTILRNVNIYQSTRRNIPEDIYSFELNSHFRPFPSYVLKYFEYRFGSRLMTCFFQIRCPKRSATHFMENSKKKFYDPQNNIISARIVRTIYDAQEGLWYYSDFHFGSVWNRWKLNQDNVHFLGHKKRRNLRFGLVRLVGDADSYFRHKQLNHSTEMTTSYDKIIFQKLPVVHVVKKYSTFQPTGMTEILYRSLPWDRYRK